ncbi:MAG: nuclear transport factor 2 family protein [Phenylobacterium sp.]|uniref:nuclear transport factor 2 family protein n=1 Tax=Phenylobacterium sp. TaxID=1871053 RepID=UPI0027366A6D|nr:nuclear transport factor 2 family protein [Phenylobacterium sp.]MDP3748297.1 nuclear transport factor 2 family protein [Phenylobacterium sp.]
MSRAVAAPERPATAHPLQKVFDACHAAWESNDPQRIVALNSPDAMFWMRDGSAPVRGREALAKHYAGVFARFPHFGWEMHRTMFGEDFWVFEWTMVANLTDTNGEAFTAKVDMVDVVNVNAAGLVTRKDVYVDGAQAAAMYARMGVG